MKNNDSADSWPTVVKVTGAILLAVSAAGVISFSNTFVHLWFSPLKEMISKYQAMMTDRGAQPMDVYLWERLHSADIRLLLGAKLAGAILALVGSVGLLMRKNWSRQLLLALFLLLTGISVASTATRIRGISLLEQKAAVFNKPEMIEEGQRRKNAVYSDGLRAIVLFAGLSVFMTRRRFKKQMVGAAGAA